MSMNKESNENIKDELRIMGKVTLNTLPGIINSMMAMTGLSTPMQAVLNFGVAAFSGSIMTISNLNNEELLNARLASIGEYVKEIEIEMQRQGVTQLSRYTDLTNISSEELNLLEDLIESGIKEKTALLKKIIQLLTVYYGQDKDKSKTDRVADTLRIVKELNEHDCRLLLYYTYIPMRDQVVLPTDEAEIVWEEIRNKRQLIHDEILNDPYILSQDIQISSVKLESLGLIKQSCSLYPSDELIELDEGVVNNSNKKAMLSEFNAKNNEGATEKYMRFIHSLGNIPFEVN
ncbi:hypothetical protein [Mesobacillus sp. S13]|uniref:hypothetical protein n=1 Tax=Mesobacillus sp. S13 TaxID=2880221 RepID=UPI001CF4BF97|nr:hypothetical protein [Mesobacillus sp. S13]